MIVQGLADDGIVEVRFTRMRSLGCPLSSETLKKL